MIINNINTEDISVVVQGSIDRENTPKLLLSIRKHLPGAEIILSTWKKQDFSVFLDYDILVKSQDPGAVAMDVNKVSPYNINRMILSTKEGLKKASRKYVLKCRSDVIVVGTDFLEYFDKYQKRDENYVLARKKILLNSLYCMKCEMEKGNVHPTPYHISDWYCFGLKEDIEDLFSLPLVEINEFARYFEYHKKEREYAIPWLSHRVWRFPPEQYLGLSYARKKFPDIQFDNCLAYDDVDIEQSERFLVNNFIILDPEDFGIVAAKNYYDDVSKHLSHCPEHVWNGLYRHYVYLQDYKKYCDAEYKLPVDRVGIERRNYEIFHRIKGVQESVEEGMPVAAKQCRYNIITPTYEGHFCYIDKYLKSFSKYVEDKEEIGIYFTINKNEEIAFSKIIVPYKKELNIHVVIFEDVLKHFNISATPQQLLERYGRFSFQTLKKFYTILYSKAEKALVLDSESMWVRKVAMKDEFEKFFSDPFISCSEIRKDLINGFVKEIVANVNTILDMECNKWFLENFVWYYDINILKALFAQYGMPIEIVEEVHKSTKYKKERPGVFEIVLYHQYIYKNVEKYNYKVINVNEECRKYLSEEQFSEYRYNFYERFKGGNGLAEHAMLFLTKNNVDAISKLFINNRYNIIRCESSDENYKYQKQFFKKVQPVILAASQNHNFGINKKVFNRNKRKRVLRIVLPVRLRGWLKKRFYDFSPNYRQALAIRESVNHVVSKEDVISCEINNLRNEVMKKEAAYSGISYFDILELAEEKDWIGKKKIYVLSDIEEDIPYCIKLNEVESIKSYFAEQEVFIVGYKDMYKEFNVVKALEAIGAKYYVVKPERKYPSYFCSKTINNEVIDLCNAREGLFDKYGYYIQALANLKDSTGQIVDIGIWNQEKMETCVWYLRSAAKLLKEIEFYDVKKKMVWNFELAENQNMGIVFEFQIKDVPALQMNKSQREFEDWFAQIEKIALLSINRAPQKNLKTVFQNLDTKLVENGSVLIECDGNLEEQHQMRCMLESYRRTSSRRYWVQEETARLWLIALN